MAKLTFEIFLSYSQICIFLSSLENPFNNWSDRNFSQGFSWRPGSASFRTLSEDGTHKINFYLNEIEPPLPTKCVRAFKVPFTTKDGKIEIASITDSAPLEISPGDYILRVEFIESDKKQTPEINVRLNKGVTDFEIMRADTELDIPTDFDLKAEPAT